MSEAAKNIQAFRDIRRRLENPANAVVDDGIDLRRGRSIGVRPSDPDLVAAAEAAALTFAQEVARAARRAERLRQLRIDRLCKAWAAKPGVRMPNNHILTVQKAVAKHFTIRLDLLTTEERTKSLVRPRHIAMYLARRLTNASLNEIGRRFSRDHTTIINACLRIEAAAKNDNALVADLSQLEQIIVATYKGDIGASAEHVCS